MVTFTSFLAKGIFIKIFLTILNCSSFQLCITSYLQQPILTKMVYRDQQLVYVIYICTPNFGNAFYDMYTHFFHTISLWFLYCWKTYCYKFDFKFICLSFKETGSLLFTFVLKKPYFSIFHTNYLINISPYIKALVNLGCQ